MPTSYYGFHEFLLKLFCHFFNKKLKKVEIEDAIEANNITSILMGNDIPARREFIISNSDFE